MEKQRFGPNVIYFDLGITEGRPAGAFKSDKEGRPIKKAGR